MVSAVEGTEATRTRDGNVRIPIRNVWLLLLWASELYQKYWRDARVVGAEDNPDKILDLVAEILAYSVERRLKRNLSFSFRRREADLRRVRGRIDLLRTERRSLLDKGFVACRFDELTVDTPSNRYVMAALSYASRQVDDRTLRSRCRNAAAALARSGVTADPMLDSSRGRGDVLRAIRREPHREDRLMLAAAQLVFDLAIPTEEAGESRMFSIERGDWLRQVFEKAVAGLYRVRLEPEWRVNRTGSKNIGWLTEDESPGLGGILPSMEQDIVLEHRASPQRIIIDTKFTNVVTKGRYREETLRSGYIYQIYAYVRSQEQDTDPASLNSTGILLHPAIDEDVDEWADIQGHRFRFATVNLNADSHAIRERLLEIVSAEGAPQILRCAQNDRR